VKRLLASRLPLVLVAAGALAAGAAGAAAPAAKSTSSARAYSIRILVPGQPVQGTPTIAAPPDAVALGGAFSYPTDGSIAAAASVSASASTNAGLRRADARATSDVASLQLFKGEISATRLFVRATAAATPTAASGGGGGSLVSGLTVLGQPVAVNQPNQRIVLGDWGTAVALEQRQPEPPRAGRKAARTTIVALHVQLTQEHGGLPAGSQILVASGDASAEAALPPPPPPPPPVKPPPPPPPSAGGTTSKPRGHPARPQPKQTRRAPHRNAAEPKPSPFGVSPIRPVPQHGHPRLSGHYVFPVFGSVSFTDTFGAPRADVAWHHGDDIFAPLGAPVLAVAKGTVFSVGWNELGGNRLWLRDRDGNDFYYAHLSAYSPLAVNGGRVDAGDVLGYVGNTGDAVGTPYHLHFEIHPVGLLRLGYDGVVDPTPYLHAWERLRTLSFSAGLATTSPVRTSGSRARPTAPEPGAILLQVADISSATGLDPAAIKAALAAGADLGSGEGQGALLGLSGRG
jgi:murein DD-endopeptidase MepM/ murein hydrolase activator NlpD